MTSGSVDIHLDEEMHRTSFRDEVLRPPFFAYGGVLDAPSYYQGHEAKTPMESESGKRKKNEKEKQEG